MDNTTHLQSEDKKVSSEMDDLQKEDQVEVFYEVQSSDNDDLQIEGEVLQQVELLNENDLHSEGKVPSAVQSSTSNDHEREDQGQVPSAIQSLNKNDLHSEGKVSSAIESLDNSDFQQEDKGELQSEMPSLNNKIISEEKAVEPIFDGTEVPEPEATGVSSTRSSDLEPEAQGYAWPDKAVALKNFVREKSVVAVSTVIRRLSGKKDEDEQNYPESEEKNDNSTSSLKDEQDVDPDIQPKEVSQKSAERSTWNPLSFIKIGRDFDTDNRVELGETARTEDSFQTPAFKGRILLYTRLGCQESREARLFLHQRQLKYVEINIDVYPIRKLELEKFTRSSAVPYVFFNEHPVGGLRDLKELDESGKLKEKINDLIDEEPSSEAPVPPLSGEDDESCSGVIDELASIVKKMRESITVKDRFYRMRRFSYCFVGSEAVDFLAEDQYLERKEAIEFGRKLASKQFFGHVLEENVFEDGNHFYRFLDHDPVVSSQCYNIPRGILDVKPKPIIDIASRLRFLSLAIFEAYASEDGRHVDYRSIHGSEEFARYLRVVEELQRAEMLEMSREEKLAFFINLYNMMAIHAILMWGYPVGPLERRKMLGDFKYVIGGYTYSLSAIQNGILRCNQRPPYNLVKPFGVKDQRTKIALPYLEPLIHFALVSGNRSGPALRCFSPSNIDKELMEAARNFLRNGGVTVDPEAKVASVSKILRWYSADFGKNEVEVLKHAANYLEPAMSEELLELLANTQLKVVYQPYDWGVNC
ncbi:hypothetical protein IFM89_007813 [Coptis chinensis]|uniref:DEP domain-containing protein n=1 Tax=Coptis chinensis TaxID=261450 RepID=A0A835HYT3_9MAGN|nr:hypothetical protein IFM89_007813 [Coptis chinensis]